MPTLYIRDVPDEVAAQLKQRAAANGQSLSAYVTAELTTLTTRPTNAEVAERLRLMDRSSGVSREDILEQLRESRR